MLRNPECGVYASQLGSTNSKNRTPKPLSLSIKISPADRQHSRTIGPRQLVPMRRNRCICAIQFNADQDNLKHYRLKQKSRDFPCGPVVKNLPSNAGMWVLSLVGELRSHML